MFFKKNKTNVIISDTNFNIIKKNVKLDFLPREGEFLYFNNDETYYLVHKVIHNIGKVNNVWVTTILSKNSENT